MVEYFTGLSGNDVSHWQTGITPLGGHSANLPGSVSGAYDQADHTRMTEFPFFTTGQYHWAIRGLGYRFECDDVDSPANVTLHQVWVR